MVPSGNDTVAAHKFYDYLWSYYLNSIAAPRTNILWSGIIYEVIFLVVLTLFFLFYVLYATHTHRKKGEMYGIQSFAGSILERMGPLSIFDYFIWGTLILWVLYYIITAILSGYVYVNPVH
jgi:hypothetical protein